jgi:hypothetical protein
MQGSGWVSNSDDENKKANGWSPFYWGLHRGSGKTPRTKYTKPNLRAFPPEQAASSVRYRTYNIDKQADTGHSLYTYSIKVCMADLRTIHTLIRGYLCCSPPSRLQSRESIVHTILSEGETMKSFRSSLLKHHSIKSSAEVCRAAVPHSCRAWSGQSLPYPVLNRNTQ